MTKTRSAAATGAVHAAWLAVLVACGEVPETRDAYGETHWASPGCHACKPGAVQLTKSADLEPFESVCVDSDESARVRYRFHVQNTADSVLHDLAVVDTPGPNAPEALVCLVTEGFCEYRAFTAENLVQCRFPLSPHDGWGCLVESDVGPDPSPYPSSARVMGTDECLQSVWSEVTLQTPTTHHCAPSPKPKVAFEVSVSSTFPQPVCLPEGDTAEGDIRFTAHNAGKVPLEAVLLQDSRTVSLESSTQFLRFYVCPTGQDTCTFQVAAPENVSSCQFSLAPDETFACAIPQTLTSNVLSLGDQLLGTAVTPRGLTVEAQSTNVLEVQSPCAPP